MSERIFLRLGDRLALGADDLQWILYKSSRKKSGGLNWAPISFVSSTKTILERCIRESGLDDDTAASAFESLSAWARLMAGRSKDLRYDIDGGNMLAYRLHSGSFPFMP
jgi:hypothetical protein